jgi:hypothetical protein
VQPKFLLDKTQNKIIIYNNRNSIFVPLVFESDEAISEKLFSCLCGYGLQICLFVVGHIREVWQIQMFGCTEVAIITYYLSRSIF